MSALYDTIGLNYADLRKPDHRIAAQIQAALGPVISILNVGAGAGSYEPPNKLITAIEPSSEMINQRAKSNATLIQGSAEVLPFDDKSFDASMAILTIHHWADKAQGVGEMRRVTRDKLVFFTIDPAFRGFWLTDYLPDLISHDEVLLPTMADFQSWLGPIDVIPVPIPHDCTDGFLTSYWRRPAAYLDEKARSAISPFWALGDISSELSLLKTDLDSGKWAEKYGHLLEKQE